MRLVPLLASTALLAGCHGDAAPFADGPDALRTFAVSGPVHAVDLRGPDDVRVRRGGTLSVVAKGPQAVLDRLRIRQEDGRLVIERHGPTMSMRGATITVTTPGIDAVALDGSGDVSLDRADGTRFAGAVSGSGNLAIDSLTAASADFDLGGSGDLNAKGKVGLLAVSVTGSGDAELGDLASDRATLALHGSGDIRTGPTGSATGALAGSGSIRVGGHPSCTIAKSGSGDVSCG